MFEETIPGTEQLGFNLCSFGSLCCGLTEEFPVVSFHGHFVPVAETYFAPNLVLLSNQGAKRLFVLGTKRPWNE